MSQMLLGSGPQSNRTGAVTRIPRTEHRGQSGWTARTRRPRSVSGGLTHIHWPACSCHAQALGRDGPTSTNSRSTSPKVRAGRSERVHQTCCEASDPTVIAAGKARSTTSTRGRDGGSRGRSDPACVRWSPRQERYTTLGSSGRPAPGHLAADRATCRAPPRRPLPAVGHASLSSRGAVDPGAPTNTGSGVGAGRQAPAASRAQTASSARKPSSEQTGSTSCERKPRLCIRPSWRSPTSKNIVRTRDFENGRVRIHPPAP